MMLRHPVHDLMRVLDLRVQADTLKRQNVYKTL